MAILRYLLSIVPLLLAIAAAGPVRAQTVTGELRDSEHGRPIAGARLMLVTLRAGVVDSASSDDGGRFQLTAPADGVYAINFELDGWAGMLSDTLHLTKRATRSYTFRVRLVSNATMSYIANILDMEARLQGSLSEICGERFRGWEAGLLIGIVRERMSQRPVPHARVSVAHDATPARTTLSSDTGVFVLCNVPAGKAINITAATPAGARQTYTLEIRAGTARWYDLVIGPAR